MQYRPPTFNVQNPNVRFKEIKRLYANVLRLDQSYIDEFLSDVDTLEGKLPDGTFANPLTPQHEAALNGFDDKMKGLYMQKVSRVIRTALANHQESGGATNRPVGRFRTLPDSAAGKRELRLCREAAIALTLAELIPGYEPRPASIHTIVSTPMGGQPGYRR